MHDYIIKVIGAKNVIYYLISNDLLERFEIIADGNAQSGIVMRFCEFHPYAMEGLDVDLRWCKMEDEFIIESEEIVFNKDYPQKFMRTVDEFYNEWHMNVQALYQHLVNLEIIENKKDRDDFFNFDTIKFNLKIPIVNDSMNLDDLQLPYDKKIILFSYLLNNYLGYKIDLTDDMFTIARSTLEESTLSDKDDEIEYEIVFEDNNIFIEPEIDWEQICAESKTTITYVESSY